MTLSKPLTHSSFLISTLATHHKSVSNNTGDSLEVGHSSAKSFKAGGEELLVEEIPLIVLPNDGKIPSSFSAEYPEHSILPSDCKIPSTLTTLDNVGRILNLLIMVSSYSKGDDGSSEAAY